MSGGGMPVGGCGRGRVSGGVMDGAVAGWMWCFTFFPA